MHWNSILANNDLWENLKIVFLTKEEQRKSLDYITPANNSMFAKLLSLEVVMFIQVYQ